jgi:acyl carrier protein
MDQPAQFSRPREIARTVMTSENIDSPATRERWVVCYLAKVLGIDQSNVDLRKGLGEYGLDSVDAMIMAGEFEEHFGVEIDPSLLFEVNNFQEMLEAWGRAPLQSGK